jgi:hypothetical protein
MTNDDNKTFGDFDFESIKSIFPPFPIDVPMPTDTAVPGSYHPPSSPPTPSPPPE